MAATDGGVIDATADVETPADSDDRPDDCGCWNADADLPCWPCYRDGFDTPKTDEPAAE